MSSGRYDTPEECDRENQIKSLRAILGDEIPKARFTEVLEASNGSLEHAIEIYFSQMQHNPKGKCSSAITSINHDTSKSVADHRPQVSTETKPTLKRRISSPDKSEKRQARLDAFFRARSGLNSPLSVQNTDAKKENGTIKKSTDGDNLDTSHGKISTSKNDDDKSQDCNSKKRGIVCVDSASFLSFQRLCETLQEMTDTTKRLIKLKALETLIRGIIDSNTSADNGSVPRGEYDLAMKSSTLSSALELVLGGITPTPLNLSASSVSKALQISLGISRHQISKAYRTYGDLGDCGACFFQKKNNFFVSKQRSRLSILQVNEGLHKLSQVEGRDSKQHILLNLLRSCQSKMECRFLVRLLIRNMRIGANVKTVLAALAMAMEPTPNNDPDLEGVCKRRSGSRQTEISSCKNSRKDAIALIQKTYDVCPSIEKIVRALLTGGVDQMKQDCSIQVMTPIAPMLAHPIHSLDEIKEKLGDFANDATMEWKYDGMRCQAHYNGYDFQLFSRHMLDMTNQFPDVITYLRDAMQTKNKSDCISFIIDAEIVGVETKGNNLRLLPFQDLSTRRKKMDDGNGIRVKMFAFDLMLFNGDSLVNEELYKRKSLLHQLFAETNDFSFVSSQKLITYDESKIKSFLSEAVENGAEGLMIKLLGRKSILGTGQNTTMKDELHATEEKSSLYEAGTRSHSWLKVKRDYVDGFSDTIDVVPIGAWWGSGRKAQKSFLSPILLAVYDDEEDVYRSICRCMTFTDAMYESIREFYFNGIAYPSIPDSQDSQNNRSNIQEEHLISDGTKINDNDIHGDDCEDNNEKDEESESYPKTEENKFKKVNCFSDRPSSAFVITNESPPIWFKPMEVFEVAFADLSLSRQHTAAAGLVDEEGGRGIALRFPRFKRRRPDKKPEQATTSIEVAQLFAKQSKIKNGSRDFQ